MTDPKTVTVQERLRARVETGERIGACTIVGDGQVILNDPGTPVTRLVNPDGPEAADLLDRCKEALEFYAGHWGQSNTPDFQPTMGLLTDGGKRAREVLTQLNGGRK